MYLSRRRFMLSTAGAFIGATRAGTAWPAQALLPPNQSAVPRWQPNAALLRHLPRLLELASVPGLGLGVVEESRTWTRGFGRAVASLGDLDGDGVTDLAVGAYLDENTQSYEGAVYVLLRK